MHYWPIRTASAGGIDIPPVGADWRLAGVGDVDGDGTDDIVWQHGAARCTTGRSERPAPGGIDIFTPVGAGLDARRRRRRHGDGTDDIVWQHGSARCTTGRWNGQRMAASTSIPGRARLDAAPASATSTAMAPTTSSGSNEGQVHYWPIQNGQRTAGINIFTPVGPDWRLAGVGDVNGDGTDDIVWQHRGGQVHYWRIQNGQRTGGHQILYAGRRRLVPRRGWKRRLQLLSAGGVGITARSSW